MCPLSVLIVADVRKQIVTAGLDKSVAIWESLHGDDSCIEDLCEAGYYELARMAVPKGPAFSMILQEGAAEDDAEGERQLYLGTHGKEILAWTPPDRATGETASTGVRLGEHCGWVRALSTCSNRWLVSAACNELQLWDMARAVPSLTASASLDKGDITALVSNKDHLFASSADGALHLFHVDPRCGTLTLVMSRPKAHSDRITSLAFGGGLAFSASYDGSIKAWVPETLEIVFGIEDAHDGERIHCLAAGPGRVLYSGGGDKLVRRWWRDTLTEAAGPLHAHSHPVNSLAFGGKDTLVSADKGGELAVWKVA